MVKFVKGMGIENLHLVWYSLSPTSLILVQWMYMNSKPPFNWSQKLIFGKMFKSKYSDLLALVLTKLIGSQQNDDVTYL